MDAGKPFCVTTKGLECPGMGDPKGRRKKQRRSLFSFPYTFLNVGWETAHFKPKAGAWTLVWGQSSPGEGNSMLLASGQPSLGAMGYAAVFSVECAKET
ncbi:hypothetical protein BTVI_02707 [Pitangus sulphuratus]|nr:hypothetical protein BTVI_02707 [Pitangus sulphuratus]